MVIDMAPTIDKSDECTLPSDTPKSVTRLLPSQVEVWVKDRLSHFAVLSGIGKDMHYTAQLAAIMLRMSYLPKRELLAGIERIDPATSIADIGFSQIISKHLSKELLDDLDAEIELAETDCRVEVVKTADQDGEVYVDGNKMVYTDHTPDAVDLSSDKGDSWASW